jgi:hypothetical protein
MIDELRNKLPAFGGRASHTRCFLHTTNLIAKALLRQFDTKKRNRGAFEREEVSESNGLDEHVYAAKTIVGDPEDGEDDTEGLVDVVDEMDPTILFILYVSSSARWPSRS